MSQRTMSRRGYRRAAVGLAAVIGVAGLLLAQGGAFAETNSAVKTGSEPGQAGSVTVSCGSQPAWKADDGYIVLGEDAKLQKAPYAACGTYARAKAGTKIWSWCAAENQYGNTWIWGRIDGTKTYGWVYLETAREVVEKPTKNDGWCQNEKPANNSEIDGDDKVVEQPPAPDADDALPVEDFDPGTDVDPALPQVGGKEDAPAADDTNGGPEGADGNEPADAQPSAQVLAAAKLKYGAPIKRTKVIARAKNWYARNVPYSQSAWAWDVNRGKKFRTDCSGFVSMSWALTSSRTTRSLDAVSHRVNWSNLKPGDMVLRKGRHVRLFEKWANKSKTAFWIYEEGSTRSDMNHYKVKVGTAKADGYKPWRYNKIRD